MFATATLVRAITAPFIAATGLTADLPVGIRRPPPAQKKKPG
jgi:hypothetical protein